MSDQDHSSSSSSSSASIAGVAMEDVVPPKKNHSGAKRKGRQPNDDEPGPMTKRRQQQTATGTSTGGVNGGGGGGGTDAFTKIHRACGGIPRVVMQWLDTKSLCNLLSILPLAEGRAVRNEKLKKDMEIASAAEPAARAEYERVAKITLARWQGEARLESQCVLQNAKDHIDHYPPFVPFPILSPGISMQRAERIPVFIKWTEAVVAAGGCLYIYNGWYLSNDWTQFWVIDDKHPLVATCEVLRRWAPTSPIAVQLAGPCPKDGGYYPPEPNWLVASRRHWPGDPHDCPEFPDRVARLDFDGKEHAPFKWHSPRRWLEVSFAPKPGSLVEERCAECGDELADLEGHFTCNECDRT